MSSPSWMLLASAFAQLLLPADAEPLVAMLAACGVGGALVVAWRGRLRPLSPGAAALIAGWLFLVGVQVLSDPDPRAGLVRVLPLLVALLLFAVAHTAVPRVDRERLLAGFGAGGAAIAGLALLLADPARAASAPLGAPEQLAGWLLLPAILGVAGLCFCGPEGRSARWNIGWFTVVALCGAGIAASRSVAALAAVASSAALLFALARYGRRPLAASAALAGIVLASLLEVFDATAAAPVAHAGFAGASWLAPFAEVGFARVPALLLSTAVALRRIRPLRRGKGSLAAWGGAGAVFCAATWSLQTPGDPSPAVVLGVALLAGLAWPAAATKELRTTRATLASLSAAVFLLVALVAV